MATLWDGKPGVEGESGVGRHCGTLVEGRPVLGGKSEMERRDQEDYLPSRLALA